jgi:hypothetical protein
MNWTKYEDVNLTKTILKVARDFIEMFILIPMDQRRAMSIPVGGAELVKALVDQTEHTWNQEWTARNFAAHNAGLGTMVNAVTYATAAGELARELRRCIGWRKLEGHEPLDAVDTAILDCETRLHTLMTDMVCELERDTCIWKLQYQNGAFVRQEIPHHDDYTGIPVLGHDDIHLKRLSYAYHLAANVAGPLVDVWNRTTELHPEKARWTQMYHRVVTEYRKTLYETAAGRDHYPRWGRDSHVRSGSEFYPLDISARRALADKLGRDSLKAVR